MSEPKSTVLPQQFPHFGLCFLLLFLLVLLLVLLALLLVLLVLLILLHFLQLELGERLEFGYKLMFFLHCQPNR